jgi:hypothetical protein
MARLVTRAVMINVFAGDPSLLRVRTLKYLDSTTSVEELETDCGRD